MFWNSLKEWMFGPVGASPYSGTWFTHAANSFYRVIGGFLIASVFGVVLGCIIGWSRLTSDLLDPIIQIIRPIPITAWVPFAVIFFGIRDGSAFFLIALGAFFPIVVNTAAGVAGTPKLLVRAARMLGIRKQNILPRVVLPSAMPLDIIIGATPSVGLLGFLSDLVIKAIGNHVLRWSRGLRAPSARKATSGSPRHCGARAAEGVCRSRQAQVVALSNIDLYIGEDEFLTILGPSGCGKSTLLNIIAGFEHATDGEVRLDGQTIRDPGPDRGSFQDMRCSLGSMWCKTSSLACANAGCRKRSGVFAPPDRSVPSAWMASKTVSAGTGRVACGNASPSPGARQPPEDPPDGRAVRGTRRADARHHEYELCASGAWMRTALFVTHNIEEAVLLGDRLVVMILGAGRIKEIVNVKLLLPRRDVGGIQRDQALCRVPAGKRSSDRNRLDAGRQECSKRTPHQFRFSGCDASGG